MRRLMTALVAFVATIGLALPIGAATAQFPDVISLPNGIAPEGIVSGSGTEFFVGSLADGALYRGDYRTGDGGFINDSADFGDTRVAVGLDYDRSTDTVWVAGGPTGNGYVYDAASGDTVAVLSLAASMPTFVNDVVVTKDAAYFTESSQSVIYVAELDRRGLPTGSVDVLPLGGDYEFFPGQFNANGIVATPNGKTLIIVNSFNGALYTVDGNTGSTTQIDLGSGEVVEVITDSDFMIPTTAAEFGNSLYAVNARFDTPPGPEVEYQVVRVAK